VHWQLAGVTRRQANRDCVSRATDSGAAGPAHSWQLVNPGREPAGGEAT
jgi:hypothetical protein